MPYGSLKVDNIIFTNGGVDQTITVSGIVASTSGNLTVTGTISGNIIRGGTTVSGATVTGSAGQFGNLTAVSGTFTTISGGTYTLTSGVFASGTAANPSISFVSDPNTGIYSPGADQVAISTSGTGRLFVASDGKVGVGTSSPQAPVDIVASGAGIKTVLNIKGSASTTNEGGAITFSNLDPATNQLAKIAGVFEGGTFAGSLRFYTNTNNEGASPSERMRLDSSGRLGLGTSSPAAGIHIATAGQTTSALDTAGNINLLVTDTGASAGNGGSVVFGFNSGAGRFASIKGQVITGAGNSTGHLTFSTRNATSDAALTERLRITNDGLVGIGTTSPGYRLDIQDAMNIKPDGSNLARIFFNGTGTRISYSDATGHLSFFTNSTERCYVGYGGGFNIISGGLNLTAGNILLSGGDRSILNSDNNALILGTNNTERARIDSSGRLLVGTSTARSNVNGGTPTTQIETATGSVSTGLSVINNSSSGFTARLALGFTKGNSVGSVTSVANSDVLGYLSYVGADGTNLIEAARIETQVDGTPGTNDMPGRLIFATTADGSSSPTERLRITSAGRMQVTGAYDSNISSASSLNIDCSAGNYFTTNIFGSSSFTVSNVPSSRSYGFTLELNLYGGSITWFSGVEWPGGTAPSLTTSKAHLFMFVTDDGGSRWRASSLINYTI